jgi:hypothetical protein
MMDEPAHKTIQRAVAITVAIGCALTLILIAQTVVRAFAAREVADAYANSVLTNASYALKRAYWDFCDQQQRDLAAFQPPKGGAPLEPWARSIRNYLNLPVAVFVRDGGRMQWLLNDPAFDSQAELLDTKLIPFDTSRRLRESGDELGSVYMWRAFTGSDRFDSALCESFIYRSSDEDRLWGVMMRHGDFWRGLFARFTQAGDSLSSSLDPWVERLSTSLQVHRPATAELRDWSLATTVRASLDGREIYRSDGLEITHPSRQDSLEGARLEFHLSHQDMLYLQLVRPTLSTYLRIVMLGIVLVALYLCWLWTKRLAAAPHL